MTLSIRSCRKVIRFGGTFSTGSLAEPRMRTDSQPRMDTDAADLEIYKSARLEAAQAAG
jgi:hypothetical protein